jgi:DNA-binding response OmpR family regulator
VRASGGEPRVAARPADPPACAPVPVTSTGLRLGPPRAGARAAHPPAVLLAEHEPEVAELARRYLDREGLRVRVTTGADETIAALGERSAAVAVLDLTMPDLDARRLRRLLAEPRSRDSGGSGNSGGSRNLGGARMPAIFLLGSGMLPGGLRVAADRCLPRPFSPRMLVARVRAVVPQAVPAARPEPAQRRVGSLTLEAAGRRVRFAGRDIALTPTEFALLTVLADNAGRVLTREQLLAAIRELGLPGAGPRRPQAAARAAWPPADAPPPGGPASASALASSHAAGGRAVDVYVAQLRAKLPGPGTIRTVRGVGYVLGERPPDAGG